MCFCIRQLSNYAYTYEAKFDDQYIGRLHYLAVVISRPMNNERRKSQIAIMDVVLCCMLAAIAVILTWIPVNLKLDIQLRTTH